jgi:hypothetical protein
VTLLATAIALVGGAAVVAPAGAYAGQWVQVSCQNPDGSASNNQGWSEVAGEGGSGSQVTDSCSPGSPMQAILSSDAPVPGGASMLLQYAPPANSTLAGGTVDVYLNGSGSGYSETGIASVESPTSQWPPLTPFCAQSLGECGSPGGSALYTGTVTLPSDQGGDVYVQADCGPANGNDCAADAVNGAWAEADLYWADLLLSSDASPAGSGFTGGLLSANAGGTQDVLFTATDSDGPGVYKVIATIDGAAVYSATPNTNGGDCVSVGTYSGAWMFDYAQPCPTSVNVDIPVATTQLTDGSHTLKIVVTDAAGNSSTVYDGTISTLNHAQSSLPPSPPASSAASSAAPAPVYGFVLSSATTALGSALHRTYPKSSLTFSGTLTGGGTVAPGVTVSLWAAAGSSDYWQQLASTTTDGAGRWSLTAPQGSTRGLRVVAGSSASSTSSSSVVSLTETVTPTLSLKIRSLSGERLVFTGKLGISPIGSPPPIVLIEAKEDGHWQTIGQQVRVRKTGAFRLDYQTSPLLTGRSFAFRAVTAATSDWLGGRSTAHTAVVQ